MTWVGDWEGGDQAWRVGDIWWDWGMMDCSSPCSFKLSLAPSPRAWRRPSMEWFEATWSAIIIRTRLAVQLFPVAFLARSTVHYHTLQQERSRKGKANISSVISTA